jgi:hypothetical protein
MTGHIFTPPAPIAPESVIRQRFQNLGGESVFGPLDRKEVDRVWYFQNGSCLCYNADHHQAFEVHGPIFDKWIALGGLDSSVPCSDETATPDGIGRYNDFNGGVASIYWTPATGACAIYGAIREKWVSLGGWDWGVPCTDETATPDGIGRFNHFNGGAASIYWTPATGACAIYGAIRERWEALGWEAGYLGYPTSDEENFPEGGRANSFQNGGIYWWTDTGAIDLRDVVVHYTGLHCFGETDWDQGSIEDEPYFIVAVTTPQISQTIRTKIYDGVNDGNTEPDLLEIYRGAPYGINIAEVLMERDFGDPDRYRGEVQQAVDKAHAAGTLALGAIPVVGVAIAAVVGPVLGKWMPAVGEAINDLFDWGDDRIGGANMTLTAKEMVLLATRTQNADFNGIGYKVETPLISGSGASYKAYFGLVPA